MLEAIRQLPENQRTHGAFKRRDLKVKGISDRRVKEILKSLTDTGYLDCDGRQGPQGYTYTLVRDTEEISLGISLRPSPDSKELLQTPTILMGGMLPPDTARCPIRASNRKLAGYRALPGETVIAQKKMLISR